MEQAAEPVAIIGMGCRFASKIESPDRFWDFLATGGNAVGRVPEVRWRDYSSRGWLSAALLRDGVSLGCFIDEIDGFDADFFGIPPREARLIDPQHRLAMEVAWEALEHAGIPARSLAGTDTGVFVGIGSDDYGRPLLEDLPGIEPWTGIGASLCGAANRVSHALDLRGPSVAMDTACSSSLVAIHAAVQSLRLGEVPLALAGGVMLMTGPALGVVLAAAGATAPDGRSKPFDAGADGYGRGEGCGFLVLKRLGDARRAGDRVIALIRGGAVRQDGRTEGIMAPSGPAQEHLMRTAYRAAGVDPATVGYVEAHGTGTKAGDPAELAALAAVLGAGRPADAPCLIGSVKANIGHLEAAAGVAGVIKAALVLHRGTIPPTPTADGPSRDIDWAQSGLALVTDTTPWPASTGPRRAGVASYGYGGTIAHLVLEQPPATPPPSRVRSRAPYLFPLSAATTRALTVNASRLAGWLTAHPDADPADVAHTLSVRRSHLPIRTVLRASDLAELRAKLADPPPASMAVANADPVWVFSGHGAQWSGMCRGLLDDEPAFADEIDRLAPVYAEEFGCSARELFTAADQSTVDVAQASLFAAQLGIAAVWRSYGVRPAAVLGHSVGEIAAAVTAGILDPLDGARLACRRARLLTRVAGHGAMALVPLPFDEAAAALAGETDIVAAVAASPATTVVSGTRTAVAEATKRFTAAGMVVRRVNSDVAFHSPHMTPLCADLAAAARDLRPRTPRVPVYSTALPDPRDPADRDGAYWAINLRAPVRFAAAIAAAGQDGHRVFLEVSTHPVVAHSIAETSTDFRVAHSLRQRRPERETMLTNLAALHVAGASVDWSATAGGGELADLPTMAWRRERLWVKAARPAVHSGHDPAGQTLLSAEPTTVPASTPVTVWQTKLDHTSRPYPGDHPVRGSEIVPAAVLLTTLLAAARTPALRDVALLVPVATTPARDVQVSEQGGALRLASRLDGAWLTHITATADSASTPGTRRVRPSGAVIDPGFPVSRLAELGVASMGFPWRIAELWQGDGTLTARVTGTGGPTFAPVLDAALSVASVGFPGPPILRMPAHLAGLAVTGTPPADVLVEVSIRGEDTAEVVIASLDGQPVAMLRGSRYGSFEPQRAGHLVHQVVWRPLIEVRMRPYRLRVIGDDHELAAMLAGPPCLDADTVVVAPRPAPWEDPAAAATRMTTQLREAVTTTTAARVWCVTRGARAATSTDGLAQTALWGLGRIAAAEYPQRWGGVVDLPLHPAGADLVALARVLGQRRTEDVIAIDGGRSTVGRLVPAPVSQAGGPGCKPEGTYLITGGTGALGLRTAAWLAGRGARRIVLLGRGPAPTRGDGDFRDVLERAGVSVTVLSADAADRDAVAAALASIDVPPVLGVVHAAGVVRNQPLETLDDLALAEVMRPKVAGAMVLHELFPPGTLDFLVLFSSAGQLLNLPGQGAYAAANAFLDGLARHRRAAGDLGSVALAWTSWRGLGMSTSSAAIDAELRAHGTADITADEALRAWSRIDSSLPANLAVLRVTGDGDQDTPLLRELAAPDTRAPAAVPWTRLRGQQRLDFLIGLTRDAAAAALGTAPDRIDPGRPLAELGIDSLLSVAMRTQLSHRLGLPVPATLLWHHPTVATIAGHLSDAHGVSDLEGITR